MKRKKEWVAAESGKRKKPFWNKECLCFVKIDADRCYGLLVVEIVDGVIRRSKSRREMAIDSEPRM